MTYATLVRGNLSRKLVRSLLLIVSIAIAFLIYCVLASFAVGFQGTDDTSNRLVVTSRISSTEPLPISLLDKIAKMEGVRAVSYATRLRAYYREPQNVVGASAVDPHLSAVTFGRDFDLSPSLLQHLGENRDGALVGRALADSQGWQVGQRITLTSTAYRREDGNNDWEFEIVGIFDGLRPTVDTHFLMLRYDYLNEARTRGRDTVDGFSVLPRTPEQGEAVAHAIDQAFANSGAETRTRTEVEFLQAFTGQLADVGTIIRLVVGAAFITLLMIVANTMLFAIRERRAEIGVLKTLGLSGRSILTLILAETLALSLAGGIFGMALAYIVVASIGSELGLVLTPGIALSALGLMALIGVCTGLLPAIGAMRLPILNALQSR